MTDERDLQHEPLTDDDLERLEAEQLPERTAQSVMLPGPGGFTILPLPPELF